MRKSGPPAAESPSATGWAAWVLGLAIAGLVAAVIWSFWPERAISISPARSAPARAPAKPFVMEDEKTAFAAYGGSASCQACHPAEFEKWAQSDHYFAERPLTEKMDKSAFDPARSFSHGAQTSDVRISDGRFEVVTLGFEGKREPWAAERVIGHDPLRQFLVKGAGGRLHALEACWDPHKSEWFNVYGNEDRKPGEWGHWTGRGMVWNQMCAGCHNTRVRKNYDPATDSYHTTMAEMTVSCESCHGPMKAHVEWRIKHPASKEPDPAVTKLTRDQMTESCAPCHTRRSELTGDFKPGDSFWDHYSPSIVDHTDIYHADGQVRDENYEFGSFLSSRMFHAGVRCMDCHDPHSARPILPGNQLCMRCHAPGGFPNAPVIQPEAHSFHKADSTGNQCVNCHMPQTVYMQRHWRHDHGFTIPDPLLTKEHGIPNACNRCHQDKDAGWALAATEKWYGEKMNRRTRERARTIAKARAGDPGARDGLLGILADDEIPYWKASAVGLLERWLREEVVGRAVLDQTAHPHPLVRGSAARTLEILIAENDTRARESVQPLLEDPARLVRSAAAWTLRDSLDLQSAAGQDLRHMLQLNADQPSGQMQLAQFEAARRNLPMAIRHMETAISWDPNSPPFHHDLAMMHSLSGSTAKAIEKLQDAIKLAPREAEYHYKLGLAFSETGQMDQAIAVLRETVRLEPRYARAWYNLGLALNGQGKVAEAIEALTQGEQAGPADPGIPYALATILAQQGRKAEAIAATERALRASPDFAEAQQLLMMLRK